MSLRSLPTTAPRLIQGPLSLAVIGGAGLLIVWCSYIFDLHAITILLRNLGGTRLLSGQDFTLAGTLAAGINLAKVALSLIIAHRIVVGGWTVGPQLARLLVLSLSLTLALVVFGSETISPNARATYDARLAAAAEARAASLTDLNGRLDAQAANTVASYEAVRADAANTARPRIAELQAQFDEERGDGGQAFKGAVYLELEALLAAANTSLTARLDLLRDEEQAALDTIASERATSIAQIDATYTTARDALDLATIAGEAEAQHPAVVAFARIVATLLGRDSVDPILITVALSVMTTLVLELLPMTLLTHAFREAGEARQARDARTAAARPLGKPHLVATSETGTNTAAAA